MPTLPTPPCPICNAAGQRIHHERGVAAALDTQCSACGWFYGARRARREARARERATHAGRPDAAR